MESWDVSIKVAEKIMNKVKMDKMPVIIIKEHLFSMISRNIGVAVENRQWTGISSWNCQLAAQDGTLPRWCDVYMWIISSK